MQEKQRTGRKGRSGTRGIREAIPSSKTMRMIKSPARLKARRVFVHIDILVEPIRSGSKGDFRHNIQTS